VVGPPDDHELHTRWIQWAAFSAVFRTHDRCVGACVCVCVCVRVPRREPARCSGGSGGSCADDSPSSCWIVEVWKVPTPYFEANRAAMQARLRLLPYLYTAMRESFDDGISLVRPM
jgi:alpha-glucosidase (family GH31 glycosyl hydrolase)